MKYPKKHKTTSPKHREDFVYVEKHGEDFTAIKLISGPFATIVYKYGQVAFAPEEEKQPERPRRGRFERRRKRGEPKDFDRRRKKKYIKRR